MTAVILHIPHAAVAIPSIWLSLFTLREREIENEILTMTDHYTDDLFDLGDVVAPLRFPVSRLLVDPERFSEDCDEPMAACGMGAVYTSTHDGRQLKSGDARDALMEAFYHPHHHALESMTAEALQRHGRCLIIDCHSFPSQPLPCDRDQTPDRPDFCIGTCEDHTPAALTETAVKAFGDLGHSVLIDRPYAGTIVPLRYLGEESSKVCSVMIEVNRKLYMDEQSGLRSDAYSATKTTLHSALTSIMQRWEEITE